MTTQARSTLAVAHGQPTPLERFLALPLVEKQAKTYSRGYQMCCPVHGDKKASMIFWEDENDGHVGINCFAGCKRVDICNALGILESALYLNARPSKASAIAPRKLDLLDLALGKLIHPGLFAMVSMEDGYTWKHPEGRQIKGVVRIPYFLEDGTPYRRARIRTALTASSGSYWEGAEAPLIPYGLWRLHEARAAKALWLVEGESDCWTHWYHNIPTLGMPGATNIGILEASYVRGVETIYMVQEPKDPGKKQDAGKQFIDGLCQRLKALDYQGDVFVVSLERSHRVKDPNELHKKLFTEGRVHEYQAELAKAIHEATPLDLAATPKPEQLAELQPLVEAAIGAQDSNALYGLAPRIAGLETREQAVLTTAIRQRMKKASGFSQRTLNKLINETHEQLGQAQQVRVTNKPDIMLSGDIELDGEATLMALYSANIPPMLFVRRGRLARCRVDEDGRPLIERLDEALVLYEMARAANFMSYNQARETYTPTYPPLAIARHILSAKGWKFSALRGVTEVPVVREDGTILDTPGYDPQTRLIYMPHPELVIPAIPANPTRKEAEQARDLAWGYLAEFPYETRADAANAFGLLLTVVIRTLISLVPLAIIDATKQGSGKGLLAKFVAYIALGRSAAAMVPPNNEDEWRKTLTSLLVEGETLISLDNVEGLLYSPALASFLTADLWKARLLGTMQSPELTQRTMMMANGNNVLLGGDIPRRSYRIRMDAGVSKPWQRTGFTYSPLLKYARADRGKIIAALLTMVRAWYVAGCPAPQKATPALAEFTSWSELVGGILSYAGVDGFLDNLDQLYEEADTEGPQWAGFLEAWQMVLGTSKYTTAQIIEKLKQEAAFGALLPEPLAGLPLEEPKEVKAFSIKLGRALQKRKGTPFGTNNYHLNKEEDTHTKQKLWSVTSVPITEAKPVRLVWNQPKSEQKGAPAAAPGEQLVVEQPTQLNGADVPVEHSVAEACEAPECGRRPEEDDGFSYDVYGHAWCHLHGNRGRVLELGGSLTPPFPLLIYLRGRMLDKGRTCWETLVTIAPDSTIIEVLRSIERYQAREQLRLKNFGESTDEPSP